MGAKNSELCGRNTSRAGLTTMQHEKATLIYNPIAGSRRKLDFHSLTQAYRQKFRELKVVATKYQGHASQLAAEANANGHSLIIVAGGDGTINESAQGLLGTDTALGIIPIGSGNGLARHLGLPLKPDQALDFAISHPSVAVDVAFLNDRPYLCTSGVGYDAEVAQTFTAIAAKRGRGLANYLLAGWQAYNRFRPQHYKIRIDGHEFEQAAFSVTVANASQFGNNAIISSQARVNDGLLDLCIIDTFPWLKGAEMTARLFAGTLEKSPLYSRIQGKHIEIERMQAGWLHYDGEPHFMPEKLSFGLEKGRLQLIGRKF